MKPFRLDQVTARIRAVMRRTNGRPSPEPIRVGELVIHEPTRVGHPRRRAARAGPAGVRPAAGARRSAPARSSASAPCSPRSGSRPTAAPTAPSTSTCRGYAASSARPRPSRATWRACAESAYAWSTPRASGTSRPPDPAKWHFSGGEVALLRATTATWAARYCHLGGGGLPPRRTCLPPHRTWLAVSAGYDVPLAVRQALVQPLPWAAGTIRSLSPWTSRTGTVTAARSKSHAPSHERLSRTKPSKVAMARWKSASNAGSRSGRSSNQFSPGGRVCWNAAWNSVVGHRLHRTEEPLRPLGQDRGGGVAVAGGEQLDRPAVGSSSSSGATSAWLPGRRGRRSSRRARARRAARARAYGPPPELPIATTASSPSWSASSSASAAAGGQAGRAGRGGAVPRAGRRDQAYAVRARAASATTAAWPAVPGVPWKKRTGAPAGSPRSAYSRVRPSRSVTVVNTARA